MYVILGATGHIGSAVAQALLESDEAVTVITRDAGKAEQWRAKGAEAALVDLNDPPRLREALRQGRRAFLLNPPARPSTDTDAEEARSIRNILEALDGSGLEKVVVQSTYSARPGEHCGDLTSLHGLEQAVNAQAIPATIVRAAYLMSNWDNLLKPAQGGTLPTMYPADREIPMVAPADVGRVAARLLREPVDATGLRAVEGPERYTPVDVAAAFADALRRKVEVAVIPRSGWEEAFRAQGFSPEAAYSFARMTAVSIDEGFEEPDDPERGTVSLAKYVGDLVRGRPASP
ncbi:MAG: NmrA family NAD(P)-binding protein [Microvirga sp.]